MPRRIDVELTSQRTDGTWTWRVAGAREPRGVLDGTLLYSGVKVGDVVRAEAEFDIDGVSVVAVIPPKETRSGGDRLELLAPTTDEPLVSATLAGGRRDRRRDAPDRPDRPDRRREGGRDRRPGGDRPPGGGRPGDRRGPSDRDHRGREGEPADSTRRRRERPPRRTDRGDRDTAGRPAEGSSERQARPERSAPQRASSRPPAEPPRPKPKRLRAGRTHRRAVLDSLPPEQRPVAEQVLQGGIPAVRQAIEKQNATSTAEGRPEIKAAPLLALAEELLPRLRTAEWRDRAEAALGDVDELDLRDLRSVVVAADVAARDDETRQLAASLRQALARRVDEEQRTWLHEIAGALNDGRVVRALRLSSRPPKAGTIFPATWRPGWPRRPSASLTAEASADRWAAVLEALAFAPVRRAVTPRSVPTEPSAELQATIQRFASRLPEVAAVFGIEAPAEPARRPRRRPPTRSTGPTRTAKPPPPPPAASTSAPAETEVTRPPDAEVAIASDAATVAAPEATEPDAVETDAADADSAELESPTAVAPDAPAPAAAEPDAAGPDLPVAGTSETDEPERAAAPAPEAPVPDVASTVVPAAQPEAAGRDAPDNQPAADPPSAGHDAEAGGTADDAEPGTTDEDDAAASELEAGEALRSR